MKLPLNWLKEYTDYGKKTPQELAEIFTLLGHEVEKIEDPAKNLDKIVVGRVLKIAKHPNADKLRIAETRVGSKIYKIVCGGSNLREGMTTVVALPGARVRWHGEGDLVELKEIEIRGIKSVGMICASSEIGMETLFPAKEEREIVDLSHLNLKDGEPLAKTLQLGSILHLDITPNRADCLSVIGLARELGAALGRELRIKNQELGTKKFKKITYNLQPTTYNLKLAVASQTLCPRYTAQVFTDVKIGESPWFIKSRLWAAGIRSINNLVDSTNYVMLETGEPMHVFDLDKLNQKQLQATSYKLQAKADIFIRNAKKGEKLKALDGKTYDLDETILVVADAEKPVAIAGIMGGEETGVTAETKNVVFEAAIFDSVSVRKTSQKLHLRSESSARFERGIPWNYPELAQARVSELFEAKHRTKNKAGNGHQLIIASSTPPRPISITQSVGAINGMLNIDLSWVKMKQILISLGFTPTSILPLKQGEEGGGRFRVTVPPWRLDIKIPEDLYEEVGRLYGINKLENTLPHGELQPASQNPLYKLAETARDELRALGYDELYTYSFYGRDTLEKDGTSPEREPHLQVENPINPNQEFLRTNVTRNLLDAASRNARIFNEVKIFEVGKVFHPPLPPVNSKSGSGGLPHEETHLALIATQKGASVEELYRKFKGDVVALIGNRVKAEFKQMDGGLDIFFDNTWVGWMGLLDETRANNWKIKEPCAMAEFNLDAVLGASFHPLRYKPTSAFPSALRDIAFSVDEKVSYEEVQKLLHGIDPLIAAIELFDIYRGKSLGEHKKSFALHITLQSSEKTLSDQEIDVVLGRLESALRSKLGAEIRS